MPNASFTMSGKIASLPDGGDLTFAVRYTTIAPVLKRIEPYDLVAGDNTIDVPVGAVVMVFTPPGSNVETLGLRKSGDTGTGIGLIPNYQNTLLLDGSGDNLVLNAGDAVSGCVLQFV